LERETAVVQLGSNTALRIPAGPPRRQVVRASAAVSPARRHRHIPAALSLCSPRCGVSRAGYARRAGAMNVCFAWPSISAWPRPCRMTSASSFLPVVRQPAVAPGIRRTKPLRMPAVWGAPCSKGQSPAGHSSGRVNACGPGIWEDSRATVRNSATGILNIGCGAMSRITELPLHATARTTTAYRWRKPWVRRRPNSQALGSSFSTLPAQTEHGSLLPECFERRGHPRTGSQPSEHDLH
jgi:hypothetical protein